MKTHPTVYGTPGGRARLIGLIRAAAPLCFALLLTGFAIGALMPWPETSVTVKCLIVAAAAISVFIFAARSARRIDAFFKGAHGEERIAFLLSQLEIDCEIFHGVDISGNPSGRLSTHDFDHIILLRSGIVIVETKNWTGPVTVENGRITVQGMEPSRDPVAQVKSQATLLKKWLADNSVNSPRIDSLICFAGNALSRKSAAVLSGVRLASEADLAASVKAFAGDEQMSDSTYEAISRLFREKV